MYSRNILETQFHHQRSIKISNEAIAFFILLDFMRWPKQSKTARAKFGRLLLTINMPICQPTG